jgi:vacuolar-type H+-ATPase subunit E/Vma4
VDSRLAAIVKDLELEAECIIQEAKAKATAERTASTETTNSLVQKIRAEALEEADNIRRRSRADMENELNEARIRSRSNLEQQIKQANAKLEKAAEIILQRLVRT